MNPLTLVYHDVNQAYSEIQTLKKQFCEWEDTRNGKAMVFQAPVLVEHTTPYRRVLFDPARNANPFFHYMEAIWMMSGSQDVKFPAKFAQNIAKYSDDGHKLHGAYGHRWKYHFDNDQIQGVIDMLMTDVRTRRAVIGMWDPSIDLCSPTKDLPCNTHIYFRFIDDRLTMTVCNRSNDLCWGMLGSNIVHFSILQEYIANACGLRVGSLYQFTNNLHVYEGWTEPDKYTYHESMWYMQQPNLKRHEFSPATLHSLEALEFVEDELGRDRYRFPIIRDNCLPMLWAWEAYKEDNIDLALHHAGQIFDQDWKVACTEWLLRIAAIRAERRS